MIDSPLVKEALGLVDVSGMGFLTMVATESPVGVLIIVVPTTASLGITYGVERVLSRRRFGGDLSIKYKRGLLHLPFAVKA